MVGALVHRPNLEPGPPGKWSKMVINGRKMVAPAFLGPLRTKPTGVVTRRCSSKIMSDAFGIDGSSRSIRPASLSHLFWSLEVQLDGGWRGSHHALVRRLLARLVVGDRGLQHAVLGA